MKMMRWQPMNDMRELSTLLDRTFQSNGYPPKSNGLTLSLDIFETEEALTLRAALPGAKKENISVEFEDQILTVSAEVEKPELPEGAQSLLQESQVGRVTRSLKIPHRLDVENSKGTFTDGVLQVVFPKAAEARKKTITIE